MSDVIQCPQCDKRFRLPEKVPPTFSCTGCGTLMDLSDFGGAEAPPEPVRPSAPAAGGGGAPRTRSQRRRGGGRRGGGGGGRRGGGAGPTRRAHAGGRARGGRGGRGRRGRGHDHDDEPHGGYAQRAQARQGNGLLIGSLIGLVAAVILVIVMVNKDGDEETDQGAGGKTDVAKGGDSAGGAGTGSAGATNQGIPGKTPGAKGVPTAADGSELTSSGTVGADGTEEVVSKKPKRKSGRHVRIGRVQLEKFPWPEEVDDETKAQVDEAITNLYRGGRDGNEAEEYLMSKGRIVCGRLISEFRRIEESPGFHSREGASMAMVIDTVLRKIDGVIERVFYEEQRIRASSDPAFTTRIAKRWTWWWKHEEWKHSPREPFDPFSETIEDIKNAAKGGGKKKKAGSGFGKRAGG